MCAAGIGWINVWSGNWGAGEQYGRQTVDAVSANGIATLDGTTVTNGVKVNGSLKMRGSHIGGSVSVNGSMNCTGSDVTGVTTINGSLLANESTFDAVSIATNTVKFDHCTVSSITVRRPSTEGETQAVHLINGTVVSGTIEFEAENGEVHISADSRVDGEITGGREV